MRTIVLVVDLPTSPEFFEADRRIEKLVRRALQHEDDPVLQTERVRIVTTSSSFRAAHVDKNINPICLIIPGLGDAFIPKFQGILARVIEDFCLDKRFDAIVNVDFALLPCRTLSVDHIPRDPVKEKKLAKKKQRIRKN